MAKPTETVSRAQWMARALALADRSLPADVPVGALVLDAEGRLIGEGWNTRERAHDPAGHAEMMAIRQAANALQNWRLTGCTLYVTLEPCPMCASALLQARMGTVVFGAADPVQGALGSALHLGGLYSESTEIVGGVEEAACQQVLQAFFKARRDKR